MSFDLLTKALNNSLLKPRDNRSVKVVYRKTEMLGRKIKSRYESNYNKNHRGWWYKWNMLPV